MSDTVRQAELTQGEVYRGWCFAVICCDRVSDIESKRFVSSRLVSSSSVIKPVRRAPTTRSKICSNSCRPHNDQELYTEGLVEFIPACERSRWNHDHSAPQRSETNGQPKWVSEESRLEQ